VTMAARQDHRPAHRVSEIELERQRLVRKVIGRVERVVAQKAKKRAVECFGIALGDQVHLRKAAATVLGRIRRSDYRKLSDGLDRGERIHETRSDDDVGIVAAIDVERAQLRAPLMLTSGVELGSVRSDMLEVTPGINSSRVMKERPLSWRSRTCSPEIRPD